MPEGVEHLVVADGIQKWCHDVDIDRNGYIPFFLEKVVSTEVFRLSPIPYNEINNHFQSIDYKNITTFGKIIFLPNKTGEYILSVQLMMTGTFSGNENKHTLSIFESLGNYIYFNDIRKFGLISCFHKDNCPPRIKKIIENGTDWRDPDIGNKIVEKLYINNKKCIKQALLSQNIIAGCGNIYASEGLHAAKIHPLKRLRDMTKEEIFSVATEIQKIMLESYKLGGMSVKSFIYFDQKGLAKKILKVYNKEGFQCKTCGTSSILKIKIQQRATFFCPHCQSNKKGMDLSWLK